MPPARSEQRLPSRPGHGLWLVRRIADRMRILSGARGTRATIAFDLPARRKGPGLPGGQSKCNWSGWYLIIFLIGSWPLSGNRRGGLERKALRSMAMPGPPLDSPPGLTPCAGEQLRLLRGTHYLRRAKTMTTMITMRTTVPMPIYIVNSSHCLATTHPELPRARRRKPLAQPAPQISHRLGAYLRLGGPARRDRNRTPWFISRGEGEFNAAGFSSVTVIGKGAATPAGSSLRKPAVWFRAPVSQSTW